MDDHDPTDSPDASPDETLTAATETLTAATKEVETWRARIAKLEADLTLTESKADDLAAARGDLALAAADGSKKKVHAYDVVIEQAHECERHRARLKDTIDAARGKLTEAEEALAAAHADHAYANALAIAQDIAQAADGFDRAVIAVASILALRADLYQRLKDTGTITPLSVYAATDPRGLHIAQAVEAAARDLGAHLVQGLTPETLGEFDRRKVASIRRPSPETYRKLTSPPPGQHDTDEARRKAGILPDPDYSAEQGEAPGIDELNRINRGYDVTYDPETGDEYYDDPVTGRRVRLSHQEGITRRTEVEVPPDDGKGAAPDEQGDGGKE